MDLNTAPGGRISNGEKTEKGYPKPLNHFNFKAITDRKGNEGYPSAPKAVLDALTPVEGRGRIQVKRIRLTFAADTPDKVMYFMIGEFMARGVKWKAADPSTVEWINGEPRMEDVLERQTDGTMELVQFDPKKHLAAFREKAEKGQKLSLRSTSVYGYLEAFVGDKWVKDPTNTFWKLVTGSGQSTDSIIKAFQAMRAQAVVDLLVEASGRSIEELTKSTIKEIAQYQHIADCYTLMGRSMEFFISGGISKDGRKYSVILSKADFDPKSLPLIAKIDTANKLALRAPELQLGMGNPSPKAIAGETSVIDAEVAPVHTEEEDDYPF